MGFDVDSLDLTTRKNILFDVLDGVPSSGKQSYEALKFREEIEHDDIRLKSTASELGISNPLIEYSSGCEL
tara:strand:+ start:600 stop:812 length:213 start_codon:yes stop_codon:yes gene_type:complete